jgi:asparagine synthase (glutamine-hydrolysing)
MSGICGIINFQNLNSATNDFLEQEIRLMVSHIAHRGIDGIDLWEFGNAAVAHLMMHTTPESIHEKQPFVSSSGLVLVADARIDNRPKLIEKLGLEVGKYISDAELIMLAYEQWGDKCVNHLIGDFVFVIWNPATQKIFVGSDHLGIRPLYYYYEKGKVFAFASEIKALLALDFVSAELNKLETAAYLSGLHDFRPLTGRTIYEAIQFILPAHYTWVDADSLEASFYWKIDTNRFLHLKTNEDFVAEFRKTFEEAVKCRIRTPFNVASHLSGG